MKTIPELIAEINGEQVYDIKYELEHDRDISTTEVIIRTFEYNGDAPFPNLRNLQCLIRRFKKIEPWCKISLCSKIEFKGTYQAVIEFNNCIFWDEVDFKGATFIKPVSILNSNFLQQANFCKCIFQSELKINHSVFNKRVTFKNATICNGVKIQNTHFKLPVSFNELGINKTVNKSIYRDVIFEDRLYYNNAQIKARIELNACQFKKKIQFHKVKFKETASFRNTTFEGLVDFYYSEFYKPQLFHQTDFLDRAIFSNITFHDQVCFLHCKTKPESYVNFESSLFQQSLDISRANFNCNINFWNIDIPECAVLPRNFHLYAKDKVIVNKGEITELAEALPKLRESYRIIKDSLRKAGNEISALTFKGREMTIYEKELVVGKKGKTILFLSKWSNKHGLSWSRGVFFTLMMTVITLYLYMLLFMNDIEWEWSTEARLSTFNSFMQILNVTNWDLELWGTKLKNTPLQYALIFVGRIFIGYGFYQTISAFRRFGKN
ncbi:MAG: pentapeptide repeat-containing protein [Carboxylicivirga sp.]|jgi:hypothetical protein|nr:pentapeptide repeat-containing protein [Carboxylicivirga sp.]